jgi:hypothetical protein
MSIPPKIVAVGFGLIVVAALSRAAASRPFPTDESLHARFLAHRVDFETLVAMAKEDNRLSRIAPGFTWLNDDVAWPRKDVGISEERWNGYRQEFRSVGALEGILKGNNPTRIIFPITSRGLVPAGSEKGLVYSEAPLTPVLKSLNKRPPGELWDGPDRSHVVAYKPIDDHWYIYYEQW